MSQYQQLKDFVKDIMKEYPELDNWDGYELQELAEKHKILIPETRNKPCDEECNCAEFSDDADFEKGVTCFRLADWLFTPDTELLAKFNGYALHWYQDNYHVIPIGKPMMEEIYCGENLEKAIEAMNQPHKIG